MPPEDRAGRYELLEVLGRQGATEVVRAVDRHHGRVVALRITHFGPDDPRDDVVAANRALLAVKPHAALPTVRDDYYVDDDTYVLVMDWIEGTPLTQFVAERGDPGVSLGTALIGLQAVADALEHIHRHDPPVLHCDVRPENVLIGPGGKVSLLWGVGSSDAGPEAEAYRAPELHSGELSRAVDVYGLAATTQFALTGAAPKPEGSLAGSDVPPDLARRLERVLRRALDPVPSRRPPSAPDFLERLAGARETTVPSGVVTFVLTDVEGSTDLWEAHPESMVRVMTRHYELAAEIAESHGGRMPRSQGEGDSTLSAYARASDAIEAVLDFQRAIRDEHWPEGITLRVRAGLHTGEAVVEHGDYFGAALSRAARVRSLARGGQVFLSQATVELVADQLPPDVTLRDLGRVQLRGLQRAEELHELVARDLPASHEPTVLTAPVSGDRTRLPFPTTLQADRDRYVDRDEELELVRLQWDRTVEEWRRRLVLVSGDPGIGKSRFAAEVARRCFDDAGGTVLHGRCYEENVVPYQPFVEVLEHITRTGAPGEVRADIVHSGTLLARLVPDMALRFPELPDPVRAEPGTERYLVFEAVNSMLSELAKRSPLLVVLDDLHWADLETIALLGHVVRSAHAAPMLVVGTYRAGEVAPDDALDQALADLKRDTLVEEVRLTGLDDDGVAELVASTLPGAPDAGFLASISRETGGNPFFVREICTHVGETGAAPEAFTLETLGVPEGVKQVIARRIARLPDGAAQLLTVGAVVGREFDIDIVLGVDGRDEDAALDLLDHASAARLVEEIPGKVGTYSFVHALTRDALYDSLGATRRARLHRRVAETLEREHALHLDEHLGELAYHYAHAGTELAKAVEYARRAGEQALGRFAHEEAAAHFERGLALLAAPELEHCDLLLGLAEARRRAGDVPGSQAAFAEAGEVARSAGDAERLALAAVGNYRGHVLANAAWHGPTIELLDEALAALPDEDSPLRSRVLSALALELYFTPGRLRGVEVAEQGVEMSRRTGDDEALAFALACAHTAITDPEHLPIRLDLSAELIAVGQRLGNSELELVGHVDRSANLLESADIDGARLEAGLAAGIVDELGQPIQRYVVMWLQSTLALLAGRFDEAEQLSNDALTLAVQAQHPDAFIVWGTQAIVLGFQRGDTSQLLEPARRLLGEFPDLTSWPAALSLVEATAGQVDDARRRLLDFTSHLDRLAFGGTWMPAMMAVAEVSRITDEPTAAELILEQLTPYADRICVVSLNVSELGPVRRSLGVLATVLGDHTAAEDHFEQALDTSRAIGARAHVARASVDYARLLTLRHATGDDERAMSLLRAATASATQLHMDGLLRDIEELRRV